MRVLLAALALFAIAADEPFQPRPITDAEKAMIRQAVKKKLIDPGSAQFRWNTRVSHSVVYCGFVNSKNRMGGYVGFTAYEVMVDRQTNSIALVDLQEDDGDLYVITKMCGERGYNLDPSDPTTVDD